MCLWTEQVKPLITEEPIIAYKLLIHTIDNKFISPYQEYDYTKYVSSNEIVKVAIPRAIKPGVSEALEYLMGLRKVYEGIHLFTKKDDAFFLAKCFRAGVIFKCEIPAGSHYFMGSNKTEICTNQFKFINGLYEFNKIV